LKRKNYRSERQQKSDIYSPCATDVILGKREKTDKLTDPRVRK